MSTIAQEIGRGPMQRLDGQFANLSQPMSPFDPTSLPLQQLGQTIDTDD